MAVGALEPVTAPTRPPAVEPAMPVGAADYDLLLARLAGEPIDGGELERLALETSEHLERRLDDLAARLGDADWRRAFSRLRQDHAPDAAATLEAYRREIARQGDFLRRQPLVALPASGVEVVETGNPIFRRYFSLAMYLDGRLALTLAPPPGEPAAENAADYLRNHCRVCIPPLVAHEVWPGHHLAYSRAEVVPAGPERLAANRSHLVYHEGWALYAELMMIEAGYYDGDLEAQLGAWRMLELRAVRAFLDPALHRGDVTPEEAERIYRQRLGMSAAAARSEVARHLRDPGLKASYFVGLLQILELRRQQEAATIDELRAFHDRLLGRPQTIPHLARQRFGGWAGPPRQMPPELAFSG